MIIESSFLYSIKDSAKITNIPTRTLSRIALANNNRKIDGRYLFLGSQLEELIEKRIRKEKNLANRSPTSRQKESLATLKYSGEVIKNLSEIQTFTLDEIENFEFEFKKDGEPSKKGNLVFVPKGLIYAEYTEEEYNFAEKKLEEWRFQNEKIKSQQELFEAKEKGLNDVVSLMTEQAEHYKNQFQYQKEQSTRILDMHEQLIKTIQQNNFIEAKSKGYDKK
jgi:hypothetical protein